MDRPPSEADYAIYDQFMGHQQQPRQGFAEGGLVDQINPFYTYITALKNFGQIPRNLPTQPGSSPQSLPPPSDYIQPVGLSSLVPQQPGQPLKFAHGGSVHYPTRQQIEDQIRMEATIRGMDPDVAVKVWQAEGAGGDPAEGWRSFASRNGVREPSYGPYQMLVGGEGTGYGAGLGNQFMKETGLDIKDPSTYPDQIRFALDQAQKQGWTPWYGAKAAGISQWQGIKDVSGGLSSLAPSAATKMAASTLTPQAASAASAGQVASQAAQLAATRAAAAKAATPMGGGLGALLALSMMNQQPMGGDQIVSADTKPRQPIDPQQETMMTSQTPDWYERRKMYGYV